MRELLLGFGFAFAFISCFFLFHLSVLYLHEMQEIFSSKRLALYSLVRFENQNLPGAKE